MPLFLRLAQDDGIKKRSNNHQIPRPWNVIIDISQTPIPLPMYRWCIPKAPNKSQSKYATNVSGPPPAGTVWTVVYCAGCW